MPVTNAPDNLVIREFTISKQIKLFRSLQDAKLTGYLTFIHPLQQTKWYFTLAQGEVLYATGGKHPLRRWQRNVTALLPELDYDLATVYQQVENLASNGILSQNEVVQLGQPSWEYKILHSWVENQEITVEQAQNLIESTIAEILFDITQGMEVICQFELNNSLLPLLPPISLASVIPETEKQWQEWQKAMIADRSPNLAPVILQAKELKERTASRVYQDLYNLLSEERTLRDIAVIKKIPPLKVTQFFLPYIQSGVMGLVEVADLPQPTIINRVLTPVDNRQQPLIACVDDSRMITAMIEQILAMAGYRFVAINNPTEAITRLNKCQPDLILLDIFMPQIDGYELCGQLRQDPNFKETPIIFLTSSDSVIDRIRSKMVGCSQFLQKTVDADKLLYTIAQHLSSEVSEL
ncbi:MAG TPA: PleD family two-component system response regulator [Xenococcaceae cyanobacterium]